MTSFTEALCHYLETTETEAEAARREALAAADVPIRRVILDLTGIPLVRPSPGANLDLATEEGWEIWAAALRLTDRWIRQVRAGERVRPGYAGAYLRKLTERCVYAHWRTRKRRLDQDGQPMLLEVAVDNELLDQWVSNPGASATHEAVERSERQALVGRIIPVLWVLICALPQPHRTIYLLRQDREQWEALLRGAMRAESSDLAGVLAQLGFEVADLHALAPRLPLTLPQIGAFIGMPDTTTVNQRLFTAYRMLAKDLYQRFPELGDFFKVSATVQGRRRHP